MLVQVNEERCDQVARSLACVGVPEPIEPWSRGASEVTFDLATLNLALVAICHQTQSLRGMVNGTERRGWDYLQVCLLNWAHEDGHRLEPDKLAAFSTDELERILNCGDQLSQSDLAHRATLIADCGAVMITKGISSFTEVYEQCGHRIATGDLNLIGWLRGLRSFNDPIRKKSLYLLGLNGSTCGWAYEDQELLDPPVDYHEVRGHLRLGTVRIVDDKLRRIVNDGQSVDEVADLAIRGGVTEAIRRISDVSGFSPMRLHYAFWNLFRSICLRRQPLCEGQLADLLPTEYRRLVADNACCFVNFCESARMNHAVDEHRFNTDWY
jgi:hypothetical protein